MPTTCQFKFSRTTPIYYSGEQISGLIVLSSTKLLAIEATDELICDKPNESCGKGADLFYYLPDYASMLLLNTFSTSVNALQTQAATHNCEQESCAADICTTKTLA
uniref:Uncharacterized protein n=1 Tax=Bactrocera latifrons TaxID=174628 RepID=A0A0K8VJF5_BACLA